MNIAEIISFAGVNGAVTHCLMLVEELANRDHEVILVHRPGAWIADQIDPKRVRLMPSTLKRTVGELRRVGYALRDQGVDVIHTHGSSAHSYGMIFRVAGKVPIVATAQSRNLQLHWFFNNRVIAPSYETADFHHRINLVPRSKIDVIPTFIDAASFKPASVAVRAEMRMRLGLSPTAFVVGSVGAVCRRKKQSNMVRSMPYLLAAGLDAQLVLVGATLDAAEERSLCAEIEAGRLADRIHLLGHRADVRAVLQAFDVYLCASIKEEMPLAVLEAMAAGLPIVSTDTGGLKDMIADGVNGYLVPYDDIVAMAARLIDVGANVERRKAFGKASRARAFSNFSPKALVPQIEETFRKVLRR